MLRVIYPFAGAGIGGAVVSTVEMLRRLRTSGSVEATVVLPYDGPARHAFEAIGVTPLVLDERAGAGARHGLRTSTPMGKLRAVPTYLRMHASASRLLRDSAFDLVHLNEDRLVLPWGLAARRLRCPVIWHVRQERPNPLLDTLRLRLAQRIVFVADANRSRFAPDRLLPKSVTLHNVVDTTAFHPGDGDKAAAKARLGLDPNRLLLTFVGNLVERKRAEWVLRAALELQHDHPLQVVLVGAATGPSGYVRELRYLGAQALEPAHVHFLGRREDVADVLRASDVATLPSIRRGEAFPRAVVEALACGVPVVATDVAGVGEAVIAHETGLLVDPDDHRAYVAALDSLLRDRARREAMGRRGAIDAAARFSGAAMAETLLELYASTRAAPR